MFDKLRRWLTPLPAEERRRRREEARLKRLRDLRESRDQWAAWEHLRIHKAFNDSAESQGQGRPHVEDFDTLLAEERLKPY